MSIWYDAHCHPTDSIDVDNVVLPPTRVGSMAAMATRIDDQVIVAKLATRHPEQVIPCFGLHPWFAYTWISFTQKIPRLMTDRHTVYCGAAPESKRAHYEAVLTEKPDDALLASLPEPESWHNFQENQVRHLEQYPNAWVGEVGLDKDRRFAIPSSSGRPHLTNVKVTMQYQQHLLRDQIHTAIQHRRPVSLHGVQCHGALFDTITALAKETMERGERMVPICLHSFSGSDQLAQRWLSNKALAGLVYFSFSYAVNHRYEKWSSVIQSIPDDRILMESDLHTGGERMEKALQDVLQCIAQAKTWSLEDAHDKLCQNWHRWLHLVNVSE